MCHHLDPQWRSSTIPYNSNVCYQDIPLFISHSLCNKWTQMFFQIIWYRSHFKIKSTVLFDVEIYPVIYFTFTQIFHDFVCSPQPARESNHCHTLITRITASDTAGKSMCSHCSCRELCKDSWQAWEGRILCNTGSQKGSRGWGGNRGTYRTP